MSKNKTFRLSDAEAGFIKTEAVRLGIPEVEVVRRAVWNASAQVEISRRLDESMTREIDRARQMLDAEFELQKASITSEVDRLIQAHLGKLVTWMQANLKK